ncbi:MAG: YdcF family protein [Alphaproteobacteria bacterium]|nr:YdcF family protein [Alphaproteobacteria bacterium]
MLFKLLKPSLLIILILGLGGIWFKSAAPTRCPTLSSDAKIFVLTGDVRRIPFAIKKLNGFPDRRLYIIGVGTHNFDPFIPDATRRQIVIENDSRTTSENAIAIREIAIAQNFKKIVLVTTADHMMRSELLILRQLPDVKITPCPVPLYGMDATRRLERWGYEYLKYLGTLMGIDSKK